MNEFMKTINHGDKQIEIRSMGLPIAEARPIELHYNTKGSINDEPTLAILMININDALVFGQMSLNTLTDCLNDLGYELKKKK